MTGCVRFRAKPAELLKQTPNSNSRKLAPARLKIVDWRCCLLRRISPLVAVRPEGANHQWRKIPPRELSIDLVADERLGRVTEGFSHFVTSMAAPVASGWSVC